MHAWWIYALLSALFASLTAILAKIGIKGVDSDVATAVRTGVILILAWGIVFARGRAADLMSLSRHSLVFLILSGVATGLSWLCYFRALQSGKVTLVAPIDKASLALTLILAVVFLGEALTFKTAMGAGLILTGTLVLIL